MKSYSSNAIRNIAVLGHNGCGKTSIMEVALNVSGATTRVGKVEEGNTVSDYEQEEIRRRVSVNASIIPVEWKDTKINFIDTPGYFDFVGEVKQAVRVADLALIVISAKSGIEVGAEKAWEYAEEAGVPRMIFINGMDDPNANYQQVLDDLHKKFGQTIAPLQVPIMEGGKFVGFVNIIREEGKKAQSGRMVDCPIPAGLENDIAHMQMLLSESVAETDDDLMERFFAGDKFTPEELIDGIQKGVVDGTVTPVICGSATAQVGIDTLLNTVNALIPPTDVLKHSKQATNLKNDVRVKIECDETKPFSAFVFKTIADPFVGRLSIFKVCSGILRKDTPLFNASKDTPEKIASLFVMRGKEQIAVNELKAGDIGAIAKLASVQTSDTLTTKEDPIAFDPIVFPKSYYTMAIAPKGKGDEDKISQALAKLREEDKTLYYKIDPETKQAVVSGAGDSHLDVMVNKLSAKYKLEVELFPAVLAFRETIKGTAIEKGRHVKQSGGGGQYGIVDMRFEPSGDLTTPYVFDEEVFGGSVPKNYFPAVEKGIQECVKAGPMAGYPVVGVKAVLFDGKYHAVDSSEIAFKMAATYAFKDGFMKAKPILLEPIAKVTVVVPDDYTGDIMGDMNKRRGRILGMNSEGGKQVINAEAPMLEMAKYTLDLRSMTQGRGSYDMDFDRYEEAPNDVATKVIAARKEA